MPAEPSLTPRPVRSGAGGLFRHFSGGFGRLPEAARRAAAGGGLGWLRRLGVYGGILILIVIAALLRPALLRPAQLLAITKLASVLGIAAVGQTFVTVARGFDISQAGLITLSIVLSNTIMNGNPHNIVAGVVVCFIVCIVVGAANGLLITLLRIPSIVATLGTFAITSGAAVIYSGGVPRGSIPLAFRIVGQGHLGPFPVSTLIWFALTALAAFYLHKTVAGRSLLAVGANEPAARQAGIAIILFGIWPYILCSVGACCAGLVYAAYMGLPDLQVSSFYMLGPIASAVVGGTSLAGGEGTMVGSSAGAFFLTFLSALIISFDLPEGVRMIITGAIIVAAIYFSHKEST